MNPAIFKLDSSGNISKAQPFL